MSRKDFVQPQKDELFQRATAQACTATWFIEQSKMRE